MDCPLTGRKLAALPGPSVRIEAFADPSRLPAAWARQVPAHHPLLQPEWMQAAARALPDGSVSRCVVAWEDDELVAAAFFEGIPLRVGSLGALETDASWQMRAALRLLAAAHCGSPYVVVCGDIIRSDVAGAWFSPDVCQPAGLFHAMSEAARTDMGVSTCMVTCSARCLGPHADALPAFGYHRIDKAEPPMRVELAPEWRSFDDYLGAMRPKYRQRARSARKKGRSLSRTPLSIVEIDAAVGTFDRLLAPIVEKAPVTLSAPTGQTVAALKRTLGEACRVHAYHLEGEMVGFAVSLHTADTVEGLLVGFDATHNRALKLYQNILYDFIEEALAAGASRASLGRTALEIKSAVGATPTEIPVYVRHPSFVMHSMLGWAAGALPTPTWTPRNPFREQARIHAAAR